MKNRTHPLLHAAILLLSLSAARAEVNTTTYHLTETTAQTLRSLGNSFVLGCTLLAIGLVAAAVVLKRK